MPNLKIEDVAQKREPANLKANRDQRLQLVVPAVLVHSLVDQIAGDYCVLDAYNAPMAMLLTTTRTTTTRTIRGRRRAG